MIARDRRFDDRRGTFGVETSEQDRGFDLGARDRQLITDAFQPCAARDPHRRLAVQGIDSRTHFPQRLGCALHGPLHERCIADQDAVELLTAQKTRHQSHCSAGIPHVERMIDALETLHSHAVNANLLRTRTFDLHAERRHGIHRRETILALEKAADFRDAFGDTAQHHRAMRNGLVARDADGTGSS